MSRAKGVYILRFEFGISRVFSPLNLLANVPENLRMPFETIHLFFLKKPNSNKMFRIEFEMSPFFLTTDHEFRILFENTCSRKITRSFLDFSPPRLFVGFRIVIIIYHHHEQLRRVLHVVRERHNPPPFPLWGRRVRWRHGNVHLSRLRARVDRRHAPV